MRKVLLGLLLATASTPAFAWDLSTSINPIDDSTTVHLIAEAVDTYTNRYGRTGRANIQILCERNTTGLALVLPELYTSDNGGLGNVTFRVDDEPAFERQMISANDHGSLAMLSGNAISALKEIVGGTLLLVQFITVNEPAMMARFDLDGIDDGIAAVQDECGW